MKIKKNLIWSLIPVKKNSKRVPGKNTKKINEIPLFVYSILSSINCKKIQKTFVSTDDKKVQKISLSLKAQAPFLRPSKICKYNSEDWEYVDHFIEYIKKNYKYLPEYIVQLRPTTPFRSIELMTKAINKIKKYKHSTSMRSSHLADHPPEKQFRIKNDFYCDVKMKKIQNDDFNKPSHVFRSTYEPNGYVDILKTENLLNNKKKIYGKKILPFITKKTMDIDTLEDFELAKKINNKEKKYLINRYKK